MKVLNRLARSLRLGCIALVIVVGAACTSITPSTPTPVPLTDTPSPYPTVPPATLTPVPSPTITPPATSNPTETPTPTATLVPTRQPNEAFWAEVSKYGVTSASIVGPKGEIYTFFAVNDVVNWPLICRLYVDRWEGNTHSTIWTHQEAGACRLVTWEDLELDKDEVEALGLEGHRSDINQNGLPEFIVFLDSLCGGCDEQNQGHTALYEIRGPGEVQDIAANLPGEIVDLWPPIPRLLHGLNPLTIYVTELTYYALHRYIRTAWIYQWDGNQYVDVSAQYPAEYQSQIKQIVTELKKKYGQLFESGTTGGYNFQEIQLILRIGNQAKLPPKDVLEAFLEVSNPSHWLGLDKVMKCWLQVARADVQIEYETDSPFRLRPFPRPPDANDTNWASTVTKGVDTTRFDVSACK